MVDGEDLIKEEVESMYKREGGIKIRKQKIEEKNYIERII